MALSEQINKKMSQSKVPGLSICVIENGEIELAEGFGVIEAGTKHPVHSNHLFHACSISKMLTATAVLRLVQEGKVELERDVNQYLTNWKIPSKAFTKKVTLQNLLAHQSGISDPAGSFDVYQTDDTFPSLDELLEGTTPYNPKQVQVTMEPETEFSYSDAGYCVVEKVIENVTGETFINAMKKLVLEPLGMNESFFWSPETVKLKSIEDNTAAGHDRQGQLVQGKRAVYPNLSGAGFWTTPTELSILMKDYMNAWNGSEQSFFKPDIVRRMFTGFSCTPSVGLGVFLSQSDKDLTVMSQGWGVGFQSLVIMHPQQRSGAVIMMNSDPGKPQEESLVGDVMKLVGEEIGWE